MKHKKIKVGGKFHDKYWRGIHFWERFILKFRCRKKFIKHKNKIYGNNNLQ